MFNEIDKKCLAEAVFAVTGQKLPEDDALVVAALFYASTVRQAGENAAKEIANAGSGIILDLASTVDAAKCTIDGTVDEAKAAIHGAVDEVKAAMRSTVGDAQAAAISASKVAEKASEVALAISRQSGLQQGAFVEILDQGLQKVLHKRHQNQSTSVSQAPAPRWQLATAALVGALAFGLGNFAACGFSLSWVNDAAVGRNFLNVIPSLDPDLKKQLIAALEKLQHRD